MNDTNGSDHGDDVDELSASDESVPPRSSPFDPELDNSDEDDDRELEISSPAARHRAQSSFSLKGGSSAFSNRSHNIFDSLDSVAQLASSSLNQDNPTDREFARPLPLRPSRKSSQPLSNCPTPAKKKGAPDYLVHPERWTHYSLEDVTETSDQDNCRAAHHFLSSLQQERRSDSHCNIQQKMIFSKPSGLLKEQLADQLSGAKAVTGKEKETRLSHLEEEEEEEEEEESGEKQKAGGGKRTDQSVEKTEETHTRGSVDGPEKKKQMQKEKGEVKIEEANPSFTSFRKVNQKNYRKSSVRKDI